MKPLYSSEESTAVFERPTEELPSSRSNARLVDLSGNGVFPLGKDSLIGRGSDASIIVEHPDASRHHARISEEEDGWYIEDLSSRNGTLVSGAPVVGRTRLEFGDTVQVASAAKYLFTLHDEVQERILHLQKMEALGQLAGGVAHDFNNVLAVITAVVDVIGDEATRGFESPQMIEECLVDARSAALRASELTHKLLGFARHGERALGPVDVSAVVTDVLTICRRTFSPDIRVVAEIEPMLQLAGDRTQLHQVVLNLCVNARDAMPEGGELSVKACSTELSAGQVSLLKPGHYVVIEVSDSGAGMDQATQRRVFEPFFTTKALRGGTGLGLATVFSIVTGHRGQVELESEPGQGARFVVYLPQLATMAEPATARATPEVPAAPATSRRAVLLVDDDEAVLRSAKRLLGVLGIETLTAKSGPAALETYAEQRERIGVVLLDLVMPGMDGEQTFKQLKDVDPAVDVVLISAAADEATLIRLRHLGVRGFVPKPFGIKALRQALVHLVRA